MIWRTLLFLTVSLTLGSPDSRPMADSDESPFQPALQSNELFTVVSSQEIRFASGVKLSTEWIDGEHHLLYRVDSADGDMPGSAEGDFICQCPDICESFCFINLEDPRTAKCDGICINIDLRIDECTFQPGSAN